MKTGCHTWVVSGVHIPLTTTGPEPGFTSRDMLCVLNASGQDASIGIVIYHSDKSPSEPYKLQLKAGKVRHIRFNDLVDPAPLILDASYAAVIRSDVPVIVQFSRVNTGQAALAIFSTIAFPVDN